jgi:hypothetical protein
LNVETLNPGVSWLAISTPHPGWFFAKSAEAIEKKGVEFFVSAKECAMV